MLLGNPISDSLITIVMLGNFTHERAGFALVFLAWSKRYFFLCNEDGWIREKAPNNYEALNMCQTLYILNFCTSLCRNCQSLVIFCRIGGSEWLSKLFKFFKLNSLRMKFGLVDYEFVI